MNFFKPLKLIKSQLLNTFVILIVNPSVNNLIYSEFLGVLGIKLTHYLCLHWLTV